jgi:hypothetical protein
MAVCPETGVVPGNGIPLHAERETMEMMEKSARIIAAPFFVFIANLPVVIVTIPGQSIRGFFYGK